MKGIVYGMYFSPTRTTKKVTETVTASMASKLECEKKEIDLTTPDSRTESFSFTGDDLLVLGMPVYGGRVHARLEDTVRNLKGDGTPAVILAVYGNRHYDDALIEMRDLLEAGGFRVIAGGAFIGEHSFSRKLGAGRPSEADLEIAADFGVKAAEKLLAGSEEKPEIPGNTPYKDRNPANVVAPGTTGDCVDCMICADACPTGTISHDDPRVASDSGSCIYCFACVKLCPAQAKYIDNERIQGFATMLETNFMEPKEPALFL